MKTRLLSLSLVLVMFLTVLAGCSNTGGSGTGTGSGSSEPASAKQEFPVTINGTEVKEAPVSIVTLSPSLADVIIALKYETLLTGRSEDCTETELSALPTVGTVKNLDVDTIKELKPQLVLSDTALSADKEKALQEAGITVLVQAQATTREEFETLYTNIGSALKGGITGFTAAQEKAKNMLMTLDDINRLIPASNAPVTACYLYDTTGAVVTGDTFASKLIEFSGAVNIASSATGGAIDVKQLTVTNPNFIFCPIGMKAKLEGDATLSQLKAVKDGKVFEMNAEKMAWQGSTIIDAVTFMAGSMYPQLTSSSNSSEASSDATSSDSSSFDASSSEASSSSSSGSSEASSSSNAQTTSNPFPAGTTIQIGDTGDNVYQLQARLLELGHSYADPTGTFDEETEQAVMNFQFLSDLAATGIADDTMLNMLYSPDAIKGPNYGL